MIGTCLTCNGRRAVPCKRCHPWLKVKPDEEIPLGAADCPDCKGKGQVPCEECEGFGFFI